MKVKSFSRVGLFVIPWTAAYQAPLSMGFSRQEYWSGLPLPSPATHLTNLDSILKSRDITLPTKVRLVKAMVFPVVTYGCESWTIKKAERQRIDAFELWDWRRLLRVTWTARRSNQSILKEITPGVHWRDWCWSWNQYFDHLMWRAESLEKTLMLGKIKGRRRRGQQRMRWLDDITNTVDMGLQELCDGQGGLACCGSWGCKELDTTEQLNWTELKLRKTEGKI